MKRTGLHSLVWLLILGGMLLAQGNSGNSVQRQVEAYLHKLYRNSPVHPKLVWLQPIRELRLPADADSLVVSHSGKRLPAGNTVFRLTFLRNGQRLRSLYLPARVELFARVFTVRQTVRQGDTLRWDMLTRQEREITDLPEMPIMEKSRIVGQIARRTLAAGTILTPRCVQPPYLVKRGEAVRIQYQRGGVRVVLQALALQDGTRGEQIWVKNPMSRKRLKVKIVERGLAVLP